jgi:hypothetical protein
VRSEPIAEPARWRVPLALPVAKLGTALALAGLAALLADGDRTQLAVAALAVAGLVGWGLRDLLAPVRLAAGPAGLTVVTGYARHRHLPWSQVERITVDRRTHLGLRTELLEVDAGDSVHLFSRHDLGAPPEEVATALLARHPGPTG